MKGAEDAILPKLNLKISQPYKKRILREILKFNSLGYRTLLYAFKYISYEKFKEIESRYEEAISNDNRNNRLFKLSKDIEDDLILLGAVAIEDKLEDKVPETIKRLIDANIKIWMLTGDKIETSESVGLSAGLIKPSHKVFYI